MPSQGRGGQPWDPGGRGLQGCAWTSEETRRAPSAAGTGQGCPHGPSLDRPAWQ